MYKSPFLQAKCLRVWNLLVVCCQAILSAECLPVLLPFLVTLSSCSNPISRLLLGRPKRIFLESLALLFLKVKVISAYSHMVQKFSVLSATPVGLNSQIYISLVSTKAPYLNSSQTSVVFRVSCFSLVNDVSPAGDPFQL